MVGWKPTLLAMSFYGGVKPRPTVGSSVALFFKGQRRTRGREAERPPWGRVGRCPALPPGENGTPNASAAGIRGGNVHWTFL